MGEIGILERGKSKHRPRNDTSLFTDGKFLFIQTGDVVRSKAKNYFISSVNNYYNDKGLKQSKLFPEGTLCITIAANIAECGFMGIDACMPDSVVAFSSPFDGLNRFAFYFILHFREELEKFAPATAQKNINLEILNNVAIPLPPLKEALAIVAEIERRHAQADALEKHLQES